MKAKLAIGLVLVFIAVAGYMLASKEFTRNVKGEETNMSANSGKKIIRAPELNGGTGWLNTDRPIYIKDLKGKVVLLDFWTYCCINCMHVIPDLKKLEARYPDELVVIGVHSAKFTNEKDSDNIRQAILRYGIQHPVVNDSEFRIWRSYGVRSWPTLVVINPDGYVAGSVSGEGNYEILDKVISTLIEEFSKQDKIDRTPLKLVLEKSKAPETLLSFPGKVIANGERLFISDSNNNRIIITNLDGNVTGVIGSKEEGTQDGAFDQASFNKPQGMTLDGDILYIADTENHLIRFADLKNKIVKTIAGTSQQARGFGDNGGKALETPLSSPWDLVLVGDKFYIAMAGHHQIWVMDLKNNYVQPYAGSGREGRIDGKLMESALAQPSGITTDGKSLYVADSEVSSIRSIDLDEKNVETVVGLDLFEFGDVDGKGREVRLQHPLGVLYHDGKIYVADTYNHKIKIVDPKAKTSQTFWGTGKPGHTDGSSPSFYEPSGLAISGNKLYVADTNNHAIRVANLSTKVVSTLVIKGLNAYTPGESSLPAKIIVLPSRKVRAGANGNLVLNLKFPPSYGLTEGAPLDYEIKPCEKINFAKADQKKTIKNPEMPLNIPFSVMDNSGDCQLKLDLTFNYCNKAKGTCSIESIRWQIPVQITKDEGDSRILIEYKITPES
jgi:thiol-disulfide isomerase/thioredoxin